MQQEKSQRVFSHQFDEDIQTIINLIKKKENFTLARFADGEYACMNALHCNGIDGWTVGPEDKELAEDLTEAYTHTEKNFFYGISCPCCDLPKHEWLKEKTDHDWGNITYSNIFVNANFNTFAHFVIEELDRPVVLIGNENAVQGGYPFTVKQFVPVKSDIVTWYRTDREQIHETFIDLAKQYEDTLFFVSAGPLSEIIISKMYKTNPNNTYVDVG